MSLSVVIPALDESRSIAAAVASAHEAGEVLVVDGGSRDDTAARALAAGATVLTAPRGRASQMNEGARRAGGDVLLFLHADSRLPPGFAREVLRLLHATPGAWGRFDLELDGGGRLFGLVAFMISLRSRLMRTATGDQALFVSRKLFDRVGGYPVQPLFEDIELARRLRRVAPMVVPPGRVVTSSRRWRASGTWRTIVGMWSLRLLYLAGVPTQRLARFYPNLREGED